MPEPSPQVQPPTTPGNEHPPDAASPPSGPPQVPDTGPPTGRRRWTVLVMVAAMAMLVGAGVTAAVFVVSDRFGQPRHEFRVTVFLDRDITADQKAAVESALSGLHPVNGVIFESREQAWARFQELFKDRPELINSAKPEHLPESFRLTTAGREFDCPALARVRELPGVDQISVVRPAKDGQPGAVIECG
jgi:cell division protein FtsX